ncbi:MAG: 50S ribosomal protein L11 methyltransferase [Chloroflexota bacterium]
MAVGSSTAFVTHSARGRSSGHRAAATPPRATTQPRAATQPGSTTSTPPTASSWLELAVEADLEAVEAVSEILGRFAPGGSSVEPAFELVDEGLGARVDPARPAIVRAYIPAEHAAAAHRAARDAEAALSHLQAFGLRPIGELQVRQVNESDWAGAWKVHFPVMRIGRRIVIRPTWRRHRATPGDVVLALDPGMAFGTGLHPTTRLCLTALEVAADRGDLAEARVLDVGCGSGILAIAAARLGARAVLAVDTDPIAVEATAANARRNRLVRRIAAHAGSLPTGEPPCDVVLANLIASVLIVLAGQLRDELRPGGLLLASGIFSDRELEVADAFRDVGLEVLQRWAEGDWVALEVRRPA